MNRRPGANEATRERARLERRAGEIARELERPIDAILKAGVDPRPRSPVGARLSTFVVHPGRFRIHRRKIDVTRACAWWFEHPFPGTASPSHCTLVIDPGAATRKGARYV
jgi:hypothetical protein